MDIKMKKIFEFCDAGYAPLVDHKFISEDLNKIVDKYAAQKLLATAGDDDGDREASVTFRINSTGNIFTSTTNINGEVSDAARNLFKSITVLFAAMTKAMSDSGKDLFDYDAWAKLIGGTGYFVEMSKYQRNLVIKSSELSVDTQIVQQLLPGLTSGSSLDIAKSVLQAMNGKFSSSETTDDSKIGHLLFINEEIMGAASVTVRLFFASKKTHETTTSSPCHKTVKTSFEQLQEANTFLFVDPDTIAEYAEKYDPEKKPEAYQRLIDSLKKAIDPNGT